MFGVCSFSVSVVVFIVNFYIVVSVVVISCVSYLYWYNIFEWFSFGVVLVFYKVDIFLISDSFCVLLVSGDVSC